MSQIHVSAARRGAESVIGRAGRTAVHPWVQWLERLGFLVRGAIYFIIGWLALQLAVGASGQTASPSSAIALIGRQPFGKILLAVVALGLVGYSLWGFVRAFLDPLHRGSDAKGLLERAGFLGSGLSYAALLVPTLSALAGTPSRGPAGAGGTGLPGALGGSGGQWLVIAFGIFWLVAGVGQLYLAITEHFLRDLRMGKMTVDEVKTATWLGKLGYSARGVVFLMIGWLVLEKAVAVGRVQQEGFDAALATLAHAPYGELVLGSVALGLALFGLYSALCARWVKISA